MRKTKSIVSISLLAILAALAFFIIQQTRNPACASPVIVFVQSKNNQPEAIARRLVAELGGLPKSDMDVYEARKLVSNGGSLPLYPVSHWQIATSSVKNSHFNTLLDDEPTYMHDFILQVRYADGDTAVLQWSSWSYGFLACPILVSTRSVASSIPINSEKHLCQIRPSTLHYPRCRQPPLKSLHNCYTNETRPLHCYATISPV